jgi:transposase
MNKKEVLNEKTLRKLYVAKQLSALKIAEKLGVSSAGVYSALKRFKIPRRGWKEAKLLVGRVDLDWGQIAKEYESGTATQVLSKKYSCSNMTVAARLRDMGVRIRKRGETLKGKPSGAQILFDVDRAKQLNQEGMTCHEVAQELGVTYGTLLYRFRSIGYKPKKNLRSKNSKGRNPQWHREEVLKELGISACQVCGEGRVLEMAHIAPKCEGHLLTKENALALCPTHHRLFDCGKLSEEELEMIQPSLAEAASKGFAHKRYAA